MSTGELHLETLRRLAAMPFLDRLELAAVSGVPDRSVYNGNCSGSRGRPHPSPLPGGILIVIQSPSHCCRGGNPALHLLPAAAPVILPLPSSCRSRHPRRSGDPEPLLSSTRLENGVPAPAPALRHCCPNRVGALSGLWIPAAARMTGDHRKQLSPKGHWIR